MFIGDLGTLLRDCCTTQGDRDNNFVPSIAGSRFCGRRHQPRESFCASPNLHASGDLFHQAALALFITLDHLLLLPIHLIALLARSSIRSLRRIVFSIDISDTYRIERSTRDSSPASPSPPDPASTDRDLTHCDLEADELVLSHTYHFSGNTNKEEASTGDHISSIRFGLLRARWCKAIGPVSGRNQHIQHITSQTSHFWAISISGRLSDTLQQGFVAESKSSVNISAQAINGFSWTANEQRPVSERAERVRKFSVQEHSHTTFDSCTSCENRRTNGGTSVADDFNGSAGDHEPEWRSIA